MSEKTNYSIQGLSLVTLLKRLDAATSRLEDITIFQEEAFKNSQSLKSASPAAAIPEHPQPVSKDSASTKTPPGPTDVSSVAPDSSTSTSTPQTASIAKAVPSPPVLPTVEEKTVSLSILDFESFISDFIEPLVSISKKIDPIVFDQANLLLQAFKAELKFLQIVIKSKKPDPTKPIFAETLQPINSEIEKMIALKDKNRTSKFFNHLNTIAEAAPVLGWVCVDIPVAFIPEFKDSSQFWSNRIMKEYKDTDPIHVEWVKTFSLIFGNLKNYVKKYHMNGLAWNANGLFFEEAIKAVEEENTPKPPKPEPTPAAAGGPAPPPPPMPPASLFEVEATPQQETGINAVFSELNKGEDITKGLRKVDKSEMTHKNPSLRASSVVSTKKTPPPAPKKPSSLLSHSSASKSVPSTPPAKTKKQPKKELVDSKWTIENISNDHTIEIDGEMFQSIFIGKCSEVTIQIHGKVNAITISESDKIGLVADTLVSGIDVIKSSHFGIQIINTCPMISIDSSDEGSVYLPKTSLNTEIFTSQTTGLNVNIPDVKDSDDYNEIPVPEQFKHTFKDGKMVSTIVQHSG
ncbi:adenylate cyclase-binding protein ASCRUDRAFT_9471 [Ascoidea rubescens DSM 1968]|uniref:Adenylyl cyclase-associated protein n=1 Tax=Ascoidea rubescens DSM 1968 TaxID=1344418 RepID=A0A1D2VCT3_9ASCO|nr:hypothetical protein ASCRUDRAFT_9471 [Ascoidea rubescens DSM 1968]ODV59419.1 hypothetical protein ASCRUDRAFT_9471 [Ascoidea rubescens DSM 1968]